MAHTQQKTEAPTPRRLQEARRRGQVAKSRDFSAAVVLMTPVILGYLLQETATINWERHLTWYFSQCLAFGLLPEHLIGAFFNLLWKVLWMFTPFILVLLVSALAVHLAQTGFVFAPQVLSPTLERINPVNGFRRIFSLRSFVELVKSVFKVGIVAGVSYIMVKSHLPTLLLIFTRPPAAAFGTAADSLLAVVAAAGGAFLVLSLGDLFYQRWDYIRGLRMTKQEVKEELKHTEGDPLIKSWQQRRRRQILLNLIRAEVPRATVVITNPVHLAVALRYEEKEMEAPRVVAKGAGELASKICELATANNVPVVTNPEVARALYYQVEIGQEIPVELYQALAQILAMIYRIQKRKLS